MRLLYVSSSNVVRPSSGMDVVCRAHLLEFLQASHLSVDAVTIAPGVTDAPASGVYRLAGMPVHVFVGDQRAERPGFSRFCAKLKMLVFRWVPVMAYSFKSDRAREFLVDLLRLRQYDCVVIDHMYTLSNIGLLQLLLSKSRLVYISHDSCRVHVLDMARIESFLIKKLYLYLESIRLYLVESLLFLCADLTIHLSEHEFNSARRRFGRHSFLMPAIQGILCEDKGFDPIKNSLDPGFEHVLFVGAPSHFPNARAIDWLIRELSPVLLKMAPRVRLGLIGEGTNRLQLPANVIGYGFVSEAELESMLTDCLCSISPVTGGGGVNVKIIKSVALGCPILATRFSLRGLDVFNIEPRVDVNNPVGVVRDILRLSEFPEERLAARFAMQDKWRAFLAGRMNRLVHQVNLVHDQAATH